MTCIFCQLRNKQDITFVKDFGNWVFRLNLSQFLPGASVLVHKEHKEGFTSLCEEELIEAFRILKRIESALQQAFHPDWFNYMQTNNSVRHFHFHIIPRYKNEVSFEGESFVDEQFKGLPKESNRVLSEKVMKRLIDRITRFL
ncbi:HIT domain-containing protein [Candidatus Woesearchaeota archaeon]|nr:HIT domain-containing protein [Candidatus Woesearchaeota archaeon]